MTDDADYCATNERRWGTPIAMVWTIDIDHGGGIMTRYKHMWDHGILVKAGAQVAAGQQIGKTGSSGWSTGAHLHFEVRVNGEATDPVEFMKSVGITLG